MAGALFLKAHVKGYMKGDGTVVLAHDTKAPVKAQWPGAFDKHPHAAMSEPGGHKGSQFPGEAAKGPPKHQMALFKKPAGIAGAQFGGETVGQAKAKWTNSLHAGGSGGYAGSKSEPAKAPFYPHAILHPRPHDDGGSFQINEPTTPSVPATWVDADAIATFVPDGAVPAELNGVPFAPWEDAPTEVVGWNYVEGQIPDLPEPPLPEALTFAGKPKEQAAGVIIEEPDGRVWVMRPTNGFGNYDATFPKGRADDGISLQAVAIKEAFEETGLKVEITGYHGDIERTTTVARYYTARRVGGTPAAMGWEAQGVQLVPRDELESVLNSTIDHKILALSNK